MVHDSQHTKGVVNGSAKTMGLAKFSTNFTGPAVSFLSGLEFLWVSTFFFEVRKVSKSNLFIVIRDV